MVDVPPEVAIRSTIKSGAVYYFTEDSFTSSEPHYFIVLNSDPLNEQVILLVCASSQIDKVRHRRKNCPAETVIEVNSVQYPGFSVDSIIDCNSILQVTITKLVEKLSKRELRLKTEMDPSLVEQFRKGVLASPMIEGQIKNLLRQ